MANEHQNTRWYKHMAEIDREFRTRLFAFGISTLMPVWTSARPLAPARSAFLRALTLPIALPGT